MLDLLKIMLGFAAMAIYMIAVGYLSYVWSEGNERIQARIHGLFMIIGLIIAATAAGVIIYL